MEENTIKISDLQDILKKNIEIDKVIEEKINPKLDEHNGWIEFVENNDNIIYVRFRGACSSCMSTYDTFEKLVKPILMKNIRNIKDVKIVNSVSEEIIELAQSLLSKNK